MQSEERSAGHRWLLWLPAILAALLLSLSGTSSAQTATITPNYKDADIRQIIEAVSDVTGRNFIVDPRVKAQVTMLSSTPMSADAFYETFLSILDVYGFVAVQSGNVVKILPDANARQMPGAETFGGDSMSSDDIITQVVEVENIGAAQLVPILRPLIPQYGHLAAHPPSNMLIISDRAANVRRLLRIIGRIDQAGDEDIEVVPLQHATAGDVVRVLTSLQQAQRDEGSGPIGLVADDRTNSVLVSGEKNQRLKLRTLIAHLDTPLEDGGNTRVRYLRYANAEDLSAKLQTQFTGTGSAAGATAQPGGAGAATAGAIQIWADELTNALIVTAPPKIMRAIMAVVDKLDIRRAQVLVEAIIVEVSADKSAELGVEWAVDGSANDNAIGIQNFPSSGVNLLGLAGAAAGGGNGGDDPDAISGVGAGITLGVGRISENGTSFVALLRALQGDANTNIISTPTIVTMDNEEASIEVGQEVPFLTGQFTNTGAAAGAVNPFQTINRESVGTKLEITPQISEGESIVLKINQEISSIAQGTAGAVDLITQERKIATSVIVENGGILVLGGLIDDTIRESEQAVPVLSSIPLLGNLFRARSTNTVKANLMVFIRTSILRTPVDTHRATGEKYNYIRDLQTGQGDIALMPRRERSALPPLETYRPPQPAEAEEIMSGEDAQE